MRESILWLHRWLGLTAGVVFAIASATGAVLVYQGPLDRLLGGPRFDATEGEQAPAAIEATVLGAHPGATIREVTWPAGENVVRVSIEAEGRGSVVWLDNGSGRFVQPRQQLLALLAIRRFHVNLFMGRFGRGVVTLATAAAVITIVLSLYLWWPGIRKLWVGFRVRLGKGAYLLSFDLHQALGIVAMPLLLFGSVTGVLMVYGGVVDRIEYAVHGPAPEPGWGEVRSVAPPDPSSASLPLARAVEAARAAAPEAHLFALRMPADEDGVIEAEFIGANGLSSKAALDPYTGEALAERSEPGFRYNRRTNEQLHVANVGGPVFDVLYMLSCLVGFTMLPTGIIMWWMKRRRLAESAERRASMRPGREPASSG